MLHQSSTQMATSSSEGDSVEAEPATAALFTANCRRRLDTRPLSASAADTPKGLLEGISSAKRITRSLNPAAPRAARACRKRTEGVTEM